MLGELLGITVWQPAEADRLTALPLDGMAPSGSRAGEPRD